MNLVTIKTYKQIRTVNETYFKISNIDYNLVLVTLVKSIEGPQDIELQITMDVFSNGMLSTSVVTRLIIFVSEYEF